MVVLVCGAQNFLAALHCSWGRNGLYIAHLEEPDANDATAGWLLVSGVRRADGRTGQGSDSSNDRGWSRGRLLFGV